MIHIYFDQLKGSQLIGNIAVMIFTVPALATGDSIAEIFGENYCFIFWLASVAARINQATSGKFNPSTIAKYSLNAFSSKDGELHCFATFA